MAGFLSDPIFGHAGIRGHLGNRAVIAAMVRVEVALAEVQAKLGIVPDDAARAIAALDAAEVPATVLADGVRGAGVPVPALVKALRTQLEPDAADWLHYGATSQDVVDTALCLCFGAALDDLGEALAALIDGLEAKAKEYRLTPMLARTRGQLATPITFGLRIAEWARPLIGLEAELREVRRAALRVQLGGASGSRSALGPEGAGIARGLAEALGLADGPPWHTDRSGFRRLSGWLARLVDACAKIGRDLAILSRGEIAEARAGAGGGSSTMPHKSNPVTAEALQSLSAMAVACEAGLGASAVHAEERDGALWPVEWALMPVLFEAAGAAAEHALKVAGGLTANADAMRARMDAMPEVRAEAVVFALAGSVGRVEAARLVYDWLAKGTPFAEGLAGYPDVDPEAALGDAGFVEPAAAVADAIFGARVKRGR